MSTISITPEEAAALDVARELAAAGIPVFVAPADSTSSTGFALPRGWQNVAADPSVVDAWRPGMAIAAVMGHGLDVIDVDPRNGGDPAALNGKTPVSYGAAVTPSGGVHSFIKSVGVRKKTNLLPGIDLQAGAPDGSGRGFVFLAPTVRVSKVTGAPVPYRWAAAPDLPRWRAQFGTDVSGLALAEMVTSSQPGPGQPTPEDFMRTGPWANIEAALAGGRNNGVAKLAAALRGRGGWRVDDAIRYMQSEVWPLIPQDGHPFTVEEFEQTIRAAWRQYPDGAEQRTAEAAVPPTPLQPPSMLRYFTEKNALQAATLAGDVIGLGPLAAGVDDVLWAYRSGVWRSAKNIVRSRVTFLLGERYRPGHTRNVEDIVRDRVPVIACDPIPSVINVRNGLLDWATGQLGEHTPQLLSTVQLNVEWDPDADCPQFEQFLAQVVPADVVDTVWELIGYLMYSGNPLHKAVMLTGTGRNGKGTFLRVMTALLGKANVTNVGLHDLVNTRFTTASLFGKLANVAGDIDGSYLENTAVLKGITGGDQISAEHKGRDRFDFTPWAVPVFSANKIPASADTTIGYLSRWLVINFPNDFTGRENRHLDQALTRQGELNGIAVKALGRLPGLLARGDFLITESAQAARDEFVRRVDQVRTWLFECTDIDAEHPWVARTELYQAYQRWAARDGHRPVRASEFYDRLDAAGAAPAVLHGTRGFKGIKITDQGHVFTITPPGAAGAGVSNSDIASVAAAAPGMVPDKAPAPSGPETGETDTETARVQVPQQVPAPSYSPENTGNPAGSGAEGAGKALTPTYTRAPAHAQVGVSENLHPLHPAASQLESDSPRISDLTRKLLQAKEAAHAADDATPTPQAAMRAEYAELKRQQDLRLEEAVRGELTDQRGRDSEEALRYFGEGEFAGDQVEPRLTWKLFLDQRRPDAELEKARQAAWEAGARLGRRHAAKPPADPDGEFDKRAKGHDSDTFAAGYASGLTEHDRAVADAGAGVCELPAIVTRDGAVRHIDITAVPEIAAGFALDTELTRDVETTGYPIGHADYALRTIQLGNEHIAIVLDADDAAHTHAAARLLHTAATLHAHSATADLVPLADASLIDLDYAWQLMHDTVIPAKLADPQSTGSDPGLKKLAAAVLGDTATAPAADQARSELFKTGKWLTDIEPTTPVERAGWAQVDKRSEVMIRYAASDVLDAAALARQLPPVPPQLLERERTAQRITAKVAHAGVRIDGDVVDAKLPEHRAQLTDAADRMRGLGIANPGSDRQVADKLIELGARLPLTATGRPSVAKGAIEPLAKLDGPVGNLVRARLDYQHHETVIGLFLEPYSQLVHRGDGRARPTVYTLSADTGRMSCVRPNLQQVPRRGGIRGCFTADPGHVIVSADFSSVEVRVAAALSQDATLKHLLDNGMDLHWEVARQAYGPDATKEDRYNTKRAVFGRLYGSGIPGIARTLGIAEIEASAIVASLDAMTPQLAAWSADLRRQVQSGLTAWQAYSGRVIHLDTRHPHKAVNYAVQGTARELLVDTLIRWQHTPWGQSVLMPVHDEVLVFVPESEAAEATAALTQCMETTLFGVTIKAEASEPSFSWKDAS